MQCYPSHSERLLTQVSSLKHPPGIRITIKLVSLTNTTGSRQSLNTRLLSQLFLPPILPVQNRPKQAHNTQIRNQIPKRKRMTQEKPRRHILTIQLSANDRAQIPNRDLQRICHAPFRLPRDVIRRPRKNDSDRRIDSRGGEDGSCVRHSGGRLG